MSSYMACTDFTVFTELIASCVHPLKGRLLYARQAIAAEQLIAMCDMNDVILRYHDKESFAADLEASSGDKVNKLLSHSAPTGDGKICEQNCEHFNAFFNHAAQPNVLQMTERFTGSHVVLIAKTKIEKGEELTVNYDCSVGYERYGHEPMMQWFLGLCSNHGVEKRPSALTMMPIKVDLSGGPTQLEPSISGSIVFLYSSHFEASRQFYEHHLCLPVRSDKGAVVFYSLPGIASHLGVVKQGLSAADIPPCSAAQAGRDTVMLCLLSDDISGWHAKLLEHGYAFDQEPQRTERFGIFNALLRDPDGYLIELQQFLDDAEQAEFCNS